MASLTDTFQNDHESVNDPVPGSTMTWPDSVMPEETLPDVQRSNDFSEFELLNSLFASENQQAYNNYAQLKANQLQNDPKQFWRFVDEKRKIKSYPDTMTFGDATGSAGHRAELFSSFFSSSTVTHQHQIVPNFEPTINVNIPQLPLVTTADIIKLISVLDANKGGGPDGLPPLFFKITSGTIAVPLTIIFNRSIITNEFPAAWKMAHVVPVLKSGSRSCVENYRGISILSCAGKLLENYITRFLTVELQPILSPDQHAYLSGKSTVTNLVEYISTILAHMESRLQIDAVYTDFSKAFDTVPHQLLLSKLRSYGVGTNVVSWVESYLSGRSQAVEIDGSISSSVFVNTGVPQGSHIGPLLFAVFINDLLMQLKAAGVNCSAYADDLKIFLPVTNVNDSTILQHAINIVNIWCHSNGMKLNASKCQVITFSRKQNRTLLVDYFVGDTTITRVRTVKDLGVFLDTQLLFNEHIDRITSRARSVLGLVKRFSKELKSDRAVLTLFRSLVRPILEYAAVAWSPHCPTKMKRVESVQKQFLLWFLRHKYPLNSYPKPPYTARLNEVRLDQISHRHQVQSIMLAFDCLNGNISSEWLRSRFLWNVPNRITRYPTSLVVQRYRADYGKFEPTNRSCMVYKSVSHLAPLNRSRNSFRRAVLAELRSANV